MSGKVYEKVASADADASSDASGSDVAGERDSSALSRRHPKTSEDIPRHDRETLTAEDEAERLLTTEDNDASALGSIFRGDPSASQDRRGQKYGKKTGWKDSRRKGAEDAVYEMEQGGRQRLSGESSGESSEVDLQKLGEVQSKRKSRASRWIKYCCIYLVIIIVFIGLLFGAYQASRSTSAHSSIGKTLSNGTSIFPPTTILISLDGFRADFLQRNLTPTLNAFVRNGVSPKYMLPSFPSLTFPNHYTLATGHYPESHGIVGNTFWDPVKGKEFYYTDPDHSMQPEWWNAEPMWVTTELQGVRTAIHMWPGSEAHIGTTEPAYVDQFNSKEALGNKVQRILDWLDLPGPEDEGANPNQPRPQFIAAYVPDVDADGHKYGPNSTEIRGTIAEADDMLAQLFRGIDERNLTDIVNIIVVSDHGMATTDVTRLIQLEDLVDTSLIEHTDGWPLYGLRPYDTSEAVLNQLHTTLLEKSQDKRYHHSFDVYLRDSTMPERYHFSNNARIAPIWIVPKTGWAIVTKDEFDVQAGLANNEVYSPRGLHGYDFEHPLMRAIFVARGPAFPHPKGSQVDVFQNTEVYNIVCDSLGIEPVANNGTLRLPLKPLGLHDDKNVEVPADPPTHSVVVPAIMPVPIPSDMPPLAAEPGADTPPSASVDVIYTTDAQGSLVTVSPGSANKDADASGERPVVHDGLVHEEGEEDENLNNHKTWWGWFENEVDDFKEWTDGIFHHGGASDGEDKESN